MGLRFKKPPEAGLLFDVDTGRVLWRHRPTRVLPIASLTKMMTALVVVDRVPARATARITAEALAYSGSGVGLLPRGKRVSVRALLHGLLLPSGNDAAIALALRAAGSVPRFVDLMNRRARQMGLVCTRFSSVSGILDRGNHSCAPDLAARLLAQRLTETIGQSVFVENRSGANGNTAGAIITWTLSGTTVLPPHAHCSWGLNTPGSGKNVPHTAASGTRSAKPAAQSLRNSAMSGLCA